MERETGIYSMRAELHQQLYEVILGAKPEAVGIEADGWPTELMRNNPVGHQPRAEVMRWRHGAVAIWATLHADYVDLVDLCRDALDGEALPGEVREAIKDVYHRK